MSMEVFFKISLFPAIQRPFFIFILDLSFDAFVKPKKTTYGYVIVCI